MFKTKKYFVFATALISTLLVSSCGPDTSTEEAAIQTAVAQTVAAQSTTEVPPTETEVVNVIPTKTPVAVTPFALLPTITPGTSSTGGNYDCAHASLGSETIIDGTIFKPGEQFTKTWEITNTSTCIWNTNYKIIFWDGNLLGGAYYYNLPQVVAPGQTIPISLVLTSPDTDGLYKSEWKLQTPDQINFGVGYLNAAFYTEIEVSSSSKPNYGVVSVETSVTRDPQYGCPANTWYTVTANVSTNGPFEFEYHWDQKDGNNSSTKTFYTDKAGTYTFTRQWKVGRADNQVVRWITFVITDPPKAKGRYTEEFDFKCP